VQFAKWVFWIAGIYGLIVLPPLYFMEAQLGRDEPPPVTHPEFYYGFVGVGIAWQVMFLIIGCDPSKYRWAMLPAMLEKASFFFAVLALYLQERVLFKWLAISSVDAVFLALFIAAFLRTKVIVSKAVDAR
jgi:hypothetical protein